MSNFEIYMLGVISGMVIAYISFWAGRLYRDYQEGQKFDLLSHVLIFGTRKNRSLTEKEGGPVNL